jgi:hypothetical protein
MKDNHVFNAYFQHVVLWLIQNDILFVKFFKEFAPSIADKIDSYVKNPNCSCKNTIQNYAIENFHDVKQFVLSFLDKNPQVKIDIDYIEKQNKVTFVRGQIFRIPKNDKAFEEFFKHITTNKFAYSHFSVAADGDSWAIFFL